MLMVFVLCMIISFKIELNVCKFNLLLSIWRFICPGLMLCRLKVCFLGLAVRNKYGLLSRLIWKRILSKGFKKIFSGCQPQSQNFIPLKLYYINYLRFPNSLKVWRIKKEAFRKGEKSCRSIFRSLLQDSKWRDQTYYINFWHSHLRKWLKWRKTTTLWVS